MSSTTTTQQPEQYSHHPCARCTHPSTKSCNKCHQTFYCSRKCLRTHHKLHKRTCAALAQAQAIRDDEDARRHRIDDAARRERMQTTAFVREFDTVQETRRWVRQVNELDRRELADEARELGEEGGG